MLMGIHKGRQQRPLSQLDPLRCGVAFRQRIAHIFDPSILFHQIAEHLILFIDR